MTGRRSLAIVAAAFVAGCTIVLAIAVWPRSTGPVVNVSTSATTVFVDYAPPVPDLQALARMPKPAAASAVWDRIAGCESGGRWDDTRGGYEGGLHFLHSTWVSAGGRRFAEHAYQATRAEQIEIAASWLASTSWRQWPTCSVKTGARHG